MVLFALVASTPAANANSKKVKAIDHHSCQVAAVGSVGCLAIRRTVTINGIAPRAVSPKALVEPNGKAVFGAKALRKAYGISAMGIGSKTIAIVDAYHAGSALQDLNTYRTTFGFPAMKSCSDVVGQCFSQMHSDGSPASGESTDDGWAQETILDIEMATAMCPNCSIAVVESTTASFSDFNDAVGLATTLPGVVAISNSYGGPEASEAEYPAYEAAYQRGIAVVASAGDSGYGVESPASFQHVIAVGGTSLFVNNSGTYLSESAWSGSGSGCAGGPAPDWQIGTGCSGKAIADVAAVANPATGVAVFYNGQWLIFGGTSASAPIIAGLLALKHNYGQPGSALPTAGQYIWQHKNALHDVVSGNNGNCRKYCKAGLKWDGPTGLGTPKGSVGF